MEQYISLIVFLIVTFLLLFIQQYIIQKGKNLATKKDIKSITKDIEIIKSQLEISTSNKKWFLEEQNKIMVQLVEKVFEINNELLKLPDWDETSKISITDKYYTKTRKKI